MSGSNSSDPDVDTPQPEPLALTVHTLPARRRLDERARRTLVGRLKMLLVLAVCAAPVIASYLTYFVLRPEGRQRPTATLIQPQRRAAGAGRCTDLDGAPRAAALAARASGCWSWSAGGACDAACEQRLYLQRQLREMLGRERDRIDKVWLVDDDAPLRRRCCRP